MRLSGILKIAVAGIFVLALPVFFGTTTLRWLVSDAGWYRAGFEKYGAAARMGASPDELARTAEPISQYLLFQRDRVDNITITINGRPEPLFNDRENKHMADVRDLFGRFYTLQTLTGIYLLLFLVTGPLWLGKAYRQTVGQGLRLGGGITVAIFLVVGALSQIDFEAFWTQVHLLSFDNDLWMLDPTKDRLIMMVPEGFWYDSAIRFALATGSQALIAILLGFLLTRNKQVIGHRSSVKGPAPSRHS